MADQYGIDLVYRICAWLPAMGLLTVLLPSRRSLRAFG
jgi:FSR family fosmidomycin resistance protein-like MFS transporter